ncbi:hypothetical protein C8J57DRAFT_627068 [Mycena rebaudengoi]|nr:hypothetical protein C8J57DRAFT_627068 [Mycena rebaudengoi]
MSTLDCTPWISCITGRLCIDLLVPDRTKRGIHRCVLSGRPPRIPMTLLGPDQDARIISCTTSPTMNSIIHRYRSQWHRASFSSHSTEVAIMVDCVFVDSGWQPAHSFKLSATSQVNRSGSWIRFDSSDILVQCGLRRTIRYGYPEHRWVAHSNHVLSRLGIASKHDDYGLVQSLDYEITFPQRSSQAPNGYLFLCPLLDMQTVDGTQFRHPECHSYWTFDPSGVERLSDNAAASHGFPSASLTVQAWTVSWDETAYAALRKFQEAKYDIAGHESPESLDVPRYRWCRDEDTSFARWTTTLQTLKTILSLKSAMGMRPVTHPVSRFFHAIVYLW